ncbi:GNAT family N-acetyltransferase [candidate division WOR-3 bacterium]|nr:GNAT family N-acetyltransferase [candidate division WOR-3 bacterium]
MTARLYEGERVFLRLVTLEDASDITTWKSDPVVQHMALGPDIEINLENQTEDIKRALDSEGELYLVIVVKETGSPIGYVRVNWMDCDKRFAWLRFALGSERGKGYSKDALRCLIAHLFERGMHRAEAEVYEFNMVSLRLLEGLGFKKEGLKREACFEGKGYSDIVVLGLLEADFV